jgi:hypothetical protein
MVLIIPKMEEPYGALSIRSRFSSFTTSRWFSKFSGVTASERMRSASSQSPRFRRLAGRDWK